jgi:hypothetical protein
MCDHQCTRKITRIVCRSTPKHTEIYPFAWRVPLINPGQGACQSPGLPARHGTARLQWPRSRPPRVDFNIVFVKTEIENPVGSIYYFK